MYLHCFSELSDFDALLTSKMENLGGGKWKCVDCSYISQSYNIKRHIESKHIVPQEYSCKYCGKVLKGRAAYDNHLYTDHKQY